MTVIRPNSISGITSITAQGDTISLFRSDGTTVGALNLNVNASSGVSTFANLVVTDGINTSGIITATSFSGSGSGLTGIAATSNISTNAIVNSGITTVAAGTSALPSISPTGDSNTGIFFPSADTIAFSEGGAEAARFDSNGKLLVGTFTSFDQASSLQVANTTGSPASLYLYGADNSQVFIGCARGTVSSPSTLNSADVIGSLHFRGHDNAGFKTGATIKAEIDAITPSNDLPTRLVFATTADGGSSPTEAMRINNQQELLVGTATRNANGGVLQLKSGITFPATAVAASDANTLDDYEEGTWTPEMADAFTGGNTAASYTAVYGDYVKIGRLVYVSAKVVYPVTTGMTSANEIFIRNLPFVAAVGQAQCYGAVFVSGLTYPAGYTFVQAWLNPNDGNTIRFVSFGSGQGYSPLKISNVTSGGSLLYFSIVINLF
jgi:hypothetical protein